MTATYPRWRGLSTPVGGPLRDCALYRFWVRHPTTGARVLGYIGETAQMPFERLMQHIQTQPWADTILGWEVDDAVYAGKDAVLAAERAAVEAERPLFNYEWNLANPDRVEIWRAKEQRAERDRARGVRPAVRVNPVRPATPARRSPAEVVLTSRWTWWTAAYLSTVAVSWWLLAKADVVVPQVVLSGRWHLGLALALPAAVVLAGWWWWATTGRRWWRKLRRWFR